MIFLQRSASSGLNRWLRCAVVVSGALISAFLGSKADAADSPLPSRPIVIAMVDTGLSLTAQQRYSPWIVGGADFIQHPFASADGDGIDADPTDPGDGVDAAFIDRNPTLCTGMPVSANTWHGDRILTLMHHLLASTPDNTPVRFMPVRVSGRCGVRLNDMVQGIRWAAGAPLAMQAPALPQPATIILLSLSGMGACPLILQQAIDAANARGVTVVVAAGNDGFHAGVVGAPGVCKGVVTVGELAADGTKARYSSVGPTVSVMVSPQTQEGSSFSAAAFAAWLAARLAAGHDEYAVDPDEHIEWRSAIRPFLPFNSTEAPPPVCKPPLQGKRCMCTVESGVCGAGWLSISTPLQ